MAVQLKTRKKERQLFREGVLGDISLPEFVVLWSYMFPIDKIYREKHKIPFNSDQHRSLSPIDMMLELAQDIAIQNAVDREMMERKDSSLVYVGGRGKYLKKKRVNKLSKEEIDKAFDDINIDDIKYNEDGSITL